MNWVIAVLFVLNAVAHVVSYRQLSARSAPNSGGVLAFAVINAVLAVLVGIDVSWAKWPALVFPALGGMGLLATTIAPRKGTPIDFTILGLDIVTVVLVIVGLIA